MKSISITVIFVVLIVFVSPLLSIQDSFRNKSYEEIGETMLSNVNPFISKLDTAANAANKTLDFFVESFNYVSSTLKTIRDFVIGLFEDKTGNTCNPNESGDGGFTCGTSEGGGGGSFGGGNR